MDDETRDLTTHAGDTGSSGRDDTLAVEQSWVQRTVVLTVSGDLDMQTAPALAGAIRAAARHGPSALIVDLSVLEFLASAGMTVLVTAQQELAPAIRFGVVADGPATSRPMRMVGVDQLVPLYRALSDAMADGD
ncbi:STAS domain-containing protein [Mycolicibacterium litorale]|uniref:STAS domain-containing protein n=1 Tax=Mycolicibacterium litorale TaxID=758802 RepID=UPI003CF74736